MPFNKTFSAAINFNIIIMTNEKTLIMKKGDQKGLKDQTLSTNHNLRCSYENLCLNDPLNGVNFCSYEVYQDEWYQQNTDESWFEQCLNVVEGCSKLWNV